MSITPAGTVTVYDVTSVAPHGPSGIAAGADGNIYFNDGNKLGELALPGGTVSTITLTGSPFTSGQMTLGPDGNFWVTAGFTIERVTPGGQVTQFTYSGSPGGQIASFNGGLYFVSGSYIRSISTSGFFGSAYQMPSGGTVQSIAVGSDGNLWFADQITVGSTLESNYGYLTPGGAIHEFPSTIGPVSGIAPGRDGNMYFRGADWLVGVNEAGVIVSEQNLGLGNNADGLELIQGADGNLWWNESFNDEIGVADISKSTPTVVVTAPVSTYTGLPVAATAAVAGLDSIFAGTLEGVAPTLMYYAGTDAMGTPLAGAPTTAGTYTAVATFPGSTDYASVSSSPVTLTILQATPSVSSVNPVNINLGAALENSQLSGVASVPGSFSYTALAGSLPAAGSGQSVAVTFTPTDSIDYATVPATAIVNVSDVESLAITNTSFTINARSLAGIAVGDVGVTGEGGDGLTYTISAIAGNSTNIAAFSINNQGVIQIAVPADLPAVKTGTQTASFDVTAADNITGLATTHPIAVIRSATQAMPPVFAVSSVTLNHLPVAAKAARTTIGTIAATAAYKGQGIVYSLTGTNAGLFAISSKGVITSKSALTAGSGYSFNVVATDRTSSAASTVAITLNIVPLAIANTKPTWVVKHNAAVKPLADVTIADAVVSDAVSVTVTVDPANATLSDPSNVAARDRFTSTGMPGVYVLSSVTAAQATRSIRALIYAFSGNGVAPGGVSTSAIAISVTDGNASVTDTNASVVTVDA